MLLARCVRCGEMYDEMQPQQTCSYHPGKFQGDDLCRVGAARGWSCCNEMQERGSGCQRATSHLRCEKTTAALDTFGKAGGLRQRKGGTPVAYGTPISEDAVVVAKPKGVPDDAVTYTVGVGDTLASIALKHRMRADQLKRWNRLLSPNVYSGQQIFVAKPPPPKPEEVRAEALRTLMRRGRCELAEAEYYLDDAGGDYAAALAALQSDGEAAGLAATDEAGGWLRIDAVKAGVGLGPKILT